MFLKKFTSNRFINFGLITSLLGISVILTLYFTGQSSIEKLIKNNQQQLEQFIGHIQAQLNRFQDIPQLIAKNQQLIERLKQPNEITQQHQVNQFLADVNQIIGASDTYLMNINGLTIAASNWQKERTFIGKNFGFRPYFIDALKGGLGRYFALGTTSGKRGYYFSYPVLSDNTILGVIVVKMNLSNIEQHWAQRDIKFIVTDRYGVVLITTRAEWLYHSLSPLPDDIRQRLLDSKQYGQKQIKELNYHILNTINEHHQTVQLGATANNRFLAITQDMPKTQWSVKVFVPLDRVAIDQRNALIVLMLVFAILFLIFYLTRQTQKRRQEKIRDQLKAQQNLKHEVNVRTADLSREIEQHKQTEQLLKATQKELIQTAKLAVLGEMSASISHELNNPLAAIRSYTDNARKFLSLNKAQQVDENLKRISVLTERMGKISSQLKLFARQSSDALSAVNVKSVIQSAIDISSPQFKAFNIRININGVKPDLNVKANQIQLEQVVINLLNNAMFAIGEHPNGLVNVSTQQQDNNIIIHIDDNGSGIDEKDMAKIFDPFYTTKKSGMGLGLSISARIIEGFGGQLSAVNHKPHGAGFRIHLQKAQDKQ